MKTPMLQSAADRPPADASEAADWWLARRALGSLSSRQEAAFQAWIAEPANRAAYDLAQGLFDEAGSFAAEPEILGLRAQALEAPLHPRRSAAPLRLAAGAVAAGLLLTGGLAWFLGQDVAEDRAASGATEAALHTAQRYETRIGERREIRLDDGSMVSLNTGSLLEVAYTASRRDVRLLRGQALFQVAHNHAWPFVVTAADRQVTAVGTAFDVRIDGPQVKVVLVEGKVRVDPIHRQGLQRLIPQLAEADVAAGQELTAREGAPSVVVSAADVRRAVSWRWGQVVFRDDSLASAAAELNRYSETRILVTDPRIAALKVSGVFSTDRPENFVAAVTAFYPIRVERTAPHVTELKWRQAG